MIRDPLALLLLPSPRPFLRNVLPIATCLSQEGQARDFFFACVAEHLDEGKQRMGIANEQRAVWRELRAYATRSKEVCTGQAHMADLRHYRLYMCITLLRGKRFQTWEASGCLQTRRTTCYSLS